MGKLGEHEHVDLHCGASGSPNKLEVLGYVLDDIFREGVEEKSKFIIDPAISLFNECKAKYETINQGGISGQSTNEGSSVASNPAIPSARART